MNNLHIRVKVKSTNYVRFGKNLYFYYLSVIRTDSNVGVIARGGGGKQKSCKPYMEFRRLTRLLLTVGGYGAHGLNNVHF